MASFSAIDLSLLPAPTVIEGLDYETVLAAMKADFRARYPEWTADLESEPVVKVLEVAAYREVLLRQRVNDAAKAVMLATATGSDLEALGALFNVARLMLDPGDPDANPPVPPTYEADAPLRRRAQLALEGITVAGSEGSYIFHALSADAHVKDAAVVSPVPGLVDVYVLSTEGDGTPAPDLLATVQGALSAEAVRPLTDCVAVKPALVRRYRVDASITVYPGPDGDVVRQTSDTAARAAVSALHGLGKDVPLSALFAALHQSGVHKVTLAEPPADIVCNDTEAAYCDGVTVTLAGTGY